MSPSLQQLLQRPDLWRPRDRRGAAGFGGSSNGSLNGSLNGREPGGLPSGYPALNRELRGGGWPRAALTELLYTHAGIGELELLLPLLARLSEQRLWQCWINPPYIPYAPALAQAGIALDELLIVRAEPRQLLWACEQALRSAACGAVLYWPAGALRYAELRKLQVAAGSQQCTGFILRETRAAAQTSPAALRLRLATAGADLSVQIVKQRGGAAGQTVLLPRAQRLQPQTPLCEQTGHWEYARPSSAIEQPRDNETSAAVFPAALTGAY